MQFFILIVLFPFLSQFSYAAENKELSLSQLRLRQPHWRKEIVARDAATKVPLVIVYYALNPRTSIEEPVKLEKYGKDGKILFEADLKTDPKDAKQWVMQGPMIRYDDQGLIASIAFMEDGLQSGEQRDYTKEGRLYRQTNFKNGLKEGKFEDYYQDGSVISKGRYANDRLHGIVEMFYPGGQNKSKELFDQGLLAGESIYFRADGSCEEKLFYRKGLLHSSKNTPAVQKFNENREKIIDENYFFGVKVGDSFEPVSQEITLIELKSSQKIEPRVEKSNQPLNGCILEYHKDGSLKTERRFNNGIPVGEHFEYFPPLEGTGKGALKRRLSYENGLFHGALESYYLNGVKESVIEYENGVLSGKSALWDENGEILEEKNYSSGRLNGNYLLKRCDGSISVTANYKDDLLDGPYEQHYPAHEFFGSCKAREANYNAGLLEGVFTEYNIAGIKVFEAPYRSGKAEGKTLTYDDEGRLISTQEYVEGLPNGVFQELTVRGRVKKECSFEKGLKEGIERVYHSNGKLAIEVPYHQGWEEGVWREWNSEGTLIFEAEYLQGKRHGWLKKFDSKGEPILKKFYEEDCLK